jgi:hypothetical protein
MGGAAFFISESLVFLSRVNNDFIQFCEIRMWVWLLLQLKETSEVIHSSVMTLVIGIYRLAELLLGVPDP